MKFILFLILISSSISVGATVKLGVVVVIDGLRAEMVQNRQEQYKYGFRRLLDDGFNFKNIHINYVPSHTGPGHAAIATGKTPKDHGIVGNYWWDQKEKKSRYVVGNKNKKGPHFLMAPTIGDILKDSNPSSLVYSASIKDRAAILLGGQSSDISVWLNKKERRFESSNQYPPLPTWIETINKKYTFPDIRSPRAMETHLSSPISDEMVLSLVDIFLSQSKLGKDDHPDLLMVGFSGVDLVGHSSGPDSRKMAAQLQSLDAILGSLIQILDERIGENKYVIALTADHGVAPVPETDEGEKIGGRRESKKQFVKNLEAEIQNIFPPSWHRLD